MSEDEIKYENSQDSGEEARMDDCTAEYVFRVFQEMNAEGDLSAAVSRWTKFLSAGKTEWILSSAKNTQNLDPAIQVVDARMIHTGMAEYEREREEKLLRSVFEDHASGYR